MAQKRGDGWLDLPLYRLTPKRIPRARGVNLVPMENLLKHDYFFRPVGLAIQKEYGKRLSLMEYWHKSKVPVGLGKHKTQALAFESMGLEGQLRRINKRIKEQIKRRRARRRK